MEKIGEFINKYIILILFILVIAIYYPISINPFGYSFSFADNLGYAKSIELLKLSIDNGTPFYVEQGSFYLNNDYKILFLTPLWQSLGVLFSYFISSIAFVNLVIIFSLFFNILFSYKLFSYLTDKKYILSFLGSIIFGASSLVLYASWFNLMGLFFIPLIVLFLVKYLKENKIKNLLYFFLFLTLLFLSSTYYVIIVSVVLLGFFIFNIKKYFKKVLILALLSIVSLGVSFMVYKIPFKVLESYNHGIEIDSLLSERKINSNIDLVRLFVPNNNNIFTKAQEYNIKSVYKNNISYFRYSFYLPIPLILLVLLIIINIIFRKEKIGKIGKIGLFITGLSLILFLGNKIVINGFDFKVNNLLYYIKQLPNGDIFRKSVYFFFSLTFGISLIIISYFSKNYNKRYNFMFLILTIFILLMNIGPYYNNYFLVKNINLSIPNNVNILSLPNSSYNNWELQYRLLEKYSNLKTIEFGNATLPNYKETVQKIKDNNLILYKILYNKKIEKTYDKCDFGYNINYVLVHKNYITNFFFYSKESGIYKVAINNLSKCKNIIQISEDEYNILFKIN